MRTTPILLCCAVLGAPLASVAGPIAFTGEVLVRLTDDDADLLSRLAARTDVTGVQHRAGTWPVYSLQLDAASDPATVASELERLPGVSWAFADRILPTELHALSLDDTYLSEQWHLENTGQNPGALPGADIGVEEAWQYTDGTGQIIGVIDSGVETAHPDLNVLPLGWDAIDEDEDPNPNTGADSSSHGTNVAGLAAAVGNNGIGVAGVAYGAQIFAVRAIGGGVSQGGMYDSFVRAVDAGAGVINNSWAFSPDEPCDPLPDLPALNEAMEYARIEGRGGLGTVIVFSAGNSGCEQNNYPMLRDNIGVIGVAAVDDRDIKSSYSVWGAHVDIGAPSEGNGRRGLWTTDLTGDAGHNGAGDNQEYTGSMGGTSGAAPIVSGTVALMLAANPRLPEETVREVLCATADKIDPGFATYDPLGWSPYYGCGRINAGAAVAAVANEAPPAPQFESPVDGGTVEIGAPLRWSAVQDPDGDALTYAVELAWSAGDDDSAEESESSLRSGLRAPEWRMRGLRWDTGTYQARVAARDAWGLGAWSDWVTFEATAPPEPAPVDEEGSGCGGGGAALLLLFGGLFGRRQRLEVGLE